MGCCGDTQVDEVEMTGIDDKTKGKYGKAKTHEPDFKGPIENRSCTDVICCILFTLFILGFIVVGALAFLWGNPKTLLYPTDSQGNLCGDEGEFKDRPNLLFFDLMECLPKEYSISTLTSIPKCPTEQICVKECPKDNKFFSSVSAKKSEMYCKYSVNATTSQKSMSELVSDKDCAPYVLDSESLLGRCIPTVIGQQLKDFLNNNDITTSNGTKATEEDVKWATLAQSALQNLKNIGEKIFADIQKVKWWMLAGFGIAMVGSLFYIIIMRWLAGLIVWASMYAVLTLLGFGTYYCHTQYKELSKTQTGDLKWEFTSNLSSYKDKKETWLAGTIILGVLLGIILLMMIGLRKRISLAIKLIEEGSKTVTSMTSTLFFPIFPWILQLALFAWFTAVLVYLATAGTPQYTENQMVNVTEDGTNGTITELKAEVTNIFCKAEDAANDLLEKYGNTTLTNSTCSFAKYETDANVMRCGVYHLFGWLWLMNFIIAFGQCALAGAFASWFWALDKKNVPKLPLMSSMWRVFRYHTGSIAFGSLIIAIVQFIRILLEYIEYKLKDQKENQAVKFLLKCMKCVFWCLEKCLKFLNKNAYIEIAIYGKNFCVSAKNAFSLLMRNIVRVAVLDKVTDFLLFIGKLSITAGMGVGSFYFFDGSTDLNYYITPIIIIVVFTWVITTLFFGVYNMAIDTLFLCFLEDMERHDGSPEKPYYSSKKILKLLNKKNKKKKDEDDDDDEDA